MTRSAKKALRKERRLRTEYGYDVNKVIRAIQKENAEAIAKVKELEAEVKKLKSELSSARKEISRHAAYRESAKSAIRKFNVKLFDARQTIKKMERVAENAGPFDKYKDNRKKWWNAAIVTMNRVAKHHPGNDRVYSFEELVNQALNEGNSIESIVLFIYEVYIGDIALNKEAIYAEATYTDDVPYEKFLLDFNLREERI